MKCIRDGDFETAVIHADAMTRMIPPPANVNVPAFIRQSTTLSTCNARAYLAYVQAEAAANKLDWDEALRRLIEADELWRELVAMSVDLDIPQARQMADTAQAMSSQMTGSCRRRITRERKLHEQIAEYERENQQLQSKIFDLASKTTATFQGGYTMAGDQFKIGKVGQAASIGSDNTVSDIHMTQAYADNALSGIDMHALAQQLDMLTERLKETAVKSEEYVSLAEVSQAADAAKKQDKAGTLAHLKAAGEKAGTWLLNVAQDIGVPLAIAAAKAALGIPG
jgi:hypothetical protein